MKDITPVCGGSHHQSPVVRSARAYLKNQSYGICKNDGVWEHKAPASARAAGAVRNHVNFAQMAQDGTRFHLFSVRQSSPVLYEFCGEYVVDGPLDTTPVPRKTGKPRAIIQRQIKKEYISGQITQYYTPRDPSWSSKEDERWLDGEVETWIDDERNWYTWPVKCVSFDDDLYNRLVACKRQRGACA